jgi:hypothetical protein
MFNNRDLGILGSGALLAVLCLFLPMSFTGKVVVGFLVLVAFMALALLRLGPDRVPPEVWMQRRVRYAWKTRQYVNQQTETETRRPEDTDASKSIHKEKRSSSDVQTILMPVNFAWDEVGVYPLLTALLAVVGVYFSVWLANGGAAELSVWFQ